MMPYRWIGAGYTFVNDGKPVAWAASEGRLPRPERGQRAVLRAERRPGGTAVTPRAPKL